MQRRISWSVLVVSLIWVIGLSVGTLADGVILPDHPEHGWLSIVYHDVEVTIRDGVVTTHVDQLFRNDTGRDVEGRYVFPLPPGAVVSSFTMWVDGEALEARILDADEARAIYEDYVRRAIDPALLEYVGRDTLSARIFPIPAGGDRRIEITYSELLSAESGTYRYRYPLDTERFSARPLERVTISVDLQTTVPLSAVYSPSHSLGVVRTAEDAATGLFEAYDVFPAQDFLLYYSVSVDAMGMTVLTYRVPGEDGFFLLIVTPPELAASAAPIPKDLVFVLDSSGSMSGRKIEQAKEALRFILENLNQDDRFAVISFSDYSSALQTQLVPVSAANIAAATAWVAGIDAQSGTNIDDALSLAFSLFEANERPRFLIFLTDGEPTVGEVDPVSIAAHAIAANAAEARVFVFGVGNDVNTVLLDQLAQENRGTTTYVLPGENLEVSLSSFYRKIASPVLADTMLTIDNVDAVDSIDAVDGFDVYPTVLQDIFRGTQLLVLGRYRLWAGRKISYLLNQIRLYGESDELVDTVVSLSRRYGIITPYTSFLVDADVGSTEEEAAAVRQAAAAPAAGATAVRGAMSLKTLSEAETVQTGVEGVRIVEDCTYFFRDDVWVDSEYVDEETIEIAVYSDAYFELTGIVSWLGPHLAIGECVVVRVGDVFVRIGEGGLEELPGDVIEVLSS